MADLDERRRLDIEREDDPTHVKLLPSSIRFHEPNPNNLPHYIDYSSKNPIRDPETGIVHDSFRNPPPYPVIQQNIRLDKANPIKDGPDDEDSDGDDSEDDHDSSRIFIRPVTKVSTHTSSSRKCLKVTSKKKRWFVKKSIRSQPPRHRSRVLITILSTSKCKFSSDGSPKKADLNHSCSIAKQLIASYNYTLSSHRWWSFIWRYIINATSNVRPCVQNKSSRCLFY
jgi:hypothetical protein